VVDERREGLQTFRCYHGKKGEEEDTGGEEPCWKGERRKGRKEERREREKTKPQTMLVSLHLFPLGLTVHLGN
jgi:hypothetical protein